MKIEIYGTPQEIAALVFAVQERQFKEPVPVRIDGRALYKAIYGNNAIPKSHTETAADTPKESKGHWERVSRDGVHHNGKTYLPEPGFMLRYAGRRVFVVSSSCGITILDSNGTILTFVPHS